MGSFFHVFFIGATGRRHSLWMSVTQGTVAVRFGGSGSFEAMFDKRLVAQTNTSQDDAAVLMWSPTPLRLRPTSTS